MKFGCKPSQELQCNCSSMIYSKVSERFFPTSFQSLKGPFGLFGGALKCGGTRRPRPDPDPSKDGMTGRGRNSNIFNCLNLAPFRGQKDRQTSGWVKGLKWGNAEEELELTLSYLRDTSCSEAQAMTPEMTRGISVHSLSFRCNTCRLTRTHLQIHYV